MSQMCTLSLLLFSLAAGCATGSGGPPRTWTLEELHPGLVKRAAFESGCPAEELELVELDKRTIGVSGCNRRMVYVQDCDVRYYQGTPIHNKCTWTLNSSNQDGEAMEGGSAGQPSQGRKPGGRQAGEGVSDASPQSDNGSGDGEWEDLPGP